MTPARALDVFIELIIPDNTAYTVLMALRHLGYEQLAEVRRADYFRLIVSADAPQPAAIAAQLSTAEIIFNPNKHRLAYASAESDDASTGRDAAGDNRKCEAVVFDKAGETGRLVRLLRDTFNMPYLAELQRGVVWRLYEKGDPASVERLRWACDQLLANRISQTYEVRPRKNLYALREETELAANGRR